MPDDTLREELYRLDGKEFQSVAVRLEADKLVVDGQDMGPTVEEIWGDSDYEYWVDIPAGAFGKLAFALIRKHYAGDPRAVEKIRDLCREAGIQHKFDTWA